MLAEKAGSPPHFLPKLWSWHVDDLLPCVLLHALCRGDFHGVDDSFLDLRVRNVQNLLSVTSTSCP